MLHAFSSERRESLKIPGGTPFYEETTYWDPSWTITHGAIQTTNIYDLEATAVGIGSGKLLSPDSYKKMVSTDLRGKTHTQPGCTTCDADERRLHLRSRHRHLGQLAAAEPAVRPGTPRSRPTCPSQKIAIAVAVTYAPEAFDDQGNYPNEADTLFRKIGAELAPDDAPPMPPPK